MIFRKIHPILHQTLERQGLFRSHGRWCSSVISHQVHEKQAKESDSFGSVSVSYERGFPQLVILLPSQNERCLFSLRPITNNVGDLIQQIRTEDHGIDQVFLKTTDGNRIAASNTIESLMEDDFDLVINDLVHRVQSPPRKEERLPDVRNLVLQLYEALQVSEYQVANKERQLLAQLEDLQGQMLPFEEKKSQLVADAERRTTVLTWAGLGLMAVQFGALARLTWWEYSWDIVEPFTYFITYGTSMAAFAYYVLTRQEFIVSDVRDREFQRSFHKRAHKVGMDVAKYNELKATMNQIEGDLMRLRDPLRSSVP